MKSQKTQTEREWVTARKMMLAAIPKEPKKVPSVAEAAKQFQNFLENLSKHPAVPLLNLPLDPNEPSFHKIKFEFTTFNMILLNFKIGAYLNTSEVARQIRVMLSIKMEIGKSDFEASDLLNSFLKEFEDKLQSLDLENLPLSAALTC